MMHSALFWIDSSFLDRNCGMSCHTCTQYSKIGRIVVKIHCQDRITSYYFSLKKSHGVETLRSLLRNALNVMDPPKIVTYNCPKKFVSTDPLHRVTTDNN